MGTELFEKRWLGYSLAVFGVAIITGALKLLGGHINPTTVALVFLLVILFIATGWGSRPAIVASLLSVVCFNFFYLPPVGTFSISDPHNWVALLAFLVTAITAGELSARARRRAKEADAGRSEIERLYRELQESFERSSQAKALQQSERLKSALLDAVTHDLRTPLTSIKASITTLLDEVNDTADDEERTIKLDADSRREMLEVINEESDRLNRFIGGLIELARIEAGEMHLRRRWGPVDEIVAAALARAESLTRRHRIIVEIQHDLPVLRVDSRAVSEVVYTLVDNAAKYSPAGSTIRVEATRSSTDEVQISVEDQGRGIPPALRERVFDKFFRATRDGDISSEPSGTGLGLAIAKGIVEAHEGRIQVTGGPDDGGTRVTFILPIGDEENEVKQASLEERHERQPVAIE